MIVESAIKKQQTEALMTWFIAKQPSRLEI